MIFSKSRGSDSNTLRRYAQYLELFTEFEELGVIEKLYAHECDLGKLDEESHVKCLSYLANENWEYGLVYLSSELLSSYASYHIKFHFVAFTYNNLGRYSLSGLY